MTTFAILYLSVLIILIGVLVGNVVLTKYLVLKSSRDSIVEERSDGFNFENEVLNEKVKIWLESQFYPFLTSCNKVILSAMKEDDSLFRNNFQGVPL